MAFFGSIGIPELVIILVIAVLVFGKRLPEVARQVGKGFIELRKGISGVEDEIQRAKSEITDGFASADAIVRETAESALESAVDDDGETAPDETPPDEPDEEAVAVYDEAAEDDQPDPSEDPATEVSDESTTSDKSEKPADNNDK